MARTVSSGGGGGASPWAAGGAATSGRLPSPPRRPGPGGLSAAEERPVRATAAAALTSPRRGHGGRRAGRLPALPGRRPGPAGGGLCKRFRFKQRRRVSAPAGVGDGVADVGGRDPRPGAGKRGTAGGCSAPAPPRPVAAPSRCPGSRSRPGGRSGPAPRACLRGSEPRARLTRVLGSAATSWALRVPMPFSGLRPRLPGPDAGTGRVCGGPPSGREAEEAGTQPGNAGGHSRGTVGKDLFSLFKLLKGSWTFTGEFCSLS